MIVRDYTEVEARPVEDVQGITVRWVVAKDDGAPNFAMRVFEVQPGCASPYHKHSWEHEVFVLAGRGEVRTEGGAKDIQAGSVVFVAPDDFHQFANTGQDVFRFICLIPHLPPGTALNPK